MDLLHKVTGWIEHNRFLVVSLVIGAIASGWFIGCQPRTPSILDPTQEVTAIQLEREGVVVQLSFNQQAAQIEQLQQNYNSRVVAANAQIEAAEADLAAQQQLRLQVLEVVAGLGTAVATGGVTAPIAIGSVVQLMTLLAVGGLGVDSVRKSRVIGKLKNGNSK